MSQKGNQKSSTNTTQIIVITAVISLIVGFIVGMRFGEFKSGEKDPGKKISLNQMPTQKQQVMNQIAAQISALEKEVQKNPENGDAWIQLGNVYFDNNRVSQAIHAYTKSLEIDPDNANVLTDLGVMYRRNKEYKKAIESFKKANQIVPSHEVSMLNIGIVRLYDLNDTAGTIDAWEKLIALNKNASMSSGQLISDIVISLKH